MKGQAPAFMLLLADQATAFISVPAASPQRSFNMVTRFGAFYQTEFRRVVAGTSAKMAVSW